MKRRAKAARARARSRPVWMEVSQRGSKRAARRMPGDGGIGAAEGGLGAAGAAEGLPKGMAPAMRSKGER